MARISYDTETTQGKILAEAIDHLIKGRAALARWHAAADVASNAGSSGAALEGGDFGAPAGEGDDLWTLAASIKSLLDGDDAGGLATFLASLDMGG